VAAGQHPDVVILDIAMSLMDGCQVARQLRLDFVKKDCFIIAVTGNADEECRLQCREAGIDVVLIKPVQPAILETLLMLECARMNRSEAAKTVGVAMQGAAQIPRKKPSAGPRDVAAQTAPFRRSASSASGLRPEMPT
jgi:CheY-like chemotaxis protein